MKNQGGITLIEILLAILILSILLAVAIPSFSSSIQSAAVTKTADYAAQMINLARTTALNTNKSVYLTLTSNNTVFCLSSMVNYSCDIGKETVATNVNVTINDSAGMPRTLQAITFDGIYAAPDNYAIFNINFNGKKKSVAVNILGLVQVSQ